MPPPFTIDAEGNRHGNLIYKNGNFPQTKSFLLRGRVKPPPFPIGAEGRRNGNQIYKNGNFSLTKSIL